MRAYFYAQSPVKNFAGKAHTRLTKAYREEKRSLIRTNMEEQVYITEEERAKCQKVVDAFAELWMLITFSSNIQWLAIKKKPLKSTI